MSQPWGKAGPAGFDFASHLNTLVFLAVGGIHPPRPTQYGVRSGARCTIVLLDGPSAGEEIPSVVLYGQRLVPRLRGSVGQVLLHRLVEGQGQGANKPNDLADPSPQDEQSAAGWVNYFPGRLEHILAEAVQDFQIQEQALLAQDRATQGQRGSQPQQWGQQQQGQWGQPAQPSNTPPAWAQPAGVGNPGNQPAYVPQPPGYNGGPGAAPSQPLPPPPPAQPPPRPAVQPAQPVRPPWQSRVVPGGQPAAPEQAGF